MEYYQYKYYVEPTTHLTIREGVRNGNFVVDATLTDLGFSGSESLDSGISGDWENIQTITTI